MNWNIKDSVLNLGDSLIKISFVILLVIGIIFAVSSMLNNPNPKPEIIAIGFIPLAITLPLFYLIFTLQDIRDNLREINKKQTKSEY
jgi:amino acid transporter